jgi:cytochrome c
MVLSRKAWWLLCSAIGVFASAAVQAQAPLTLEQGQALAKKQACLGCHVMSGRRVGPGFIQVAQRYAGQPEALEYLATVIRKGGRDKWGAVPMPANTRLTQEQALELAQWILSLKE